MQGQFVSWFLFSDVKWGQILEAEAEHKSPRPRTNLRGRGRGQNHEAEANFPRPKITFNIIMFTTQTVQYINVSSLLSFVIIIIINHKK